MPGATRLYHAAWQVGAKTNTEPAEQEKTVKDLRARLIA